MKKSRKRSSSRKSSKTARRWGIEIVVLCLLLLVAAYVGHDSGDKPARPVQTAEKAEKRKPAVQAAKKQETPKPAVKKEQPEKKQTAKPEPARKAETKAPAKQEMPSRTSASPAPTAQEYQLVHASDGDSFELQDSRKRKIRVRLYGIDAPESSQAWGRESRAHLLKILKGRKVIIKTMYQDDYKRSVAMVYLSNSGRPDELSINQRQVQAGMAWVYDYYCKNAVCNTWKLEEAMARKQKLGLWKDRNPTPPWQWRRSNSR